MQTILTDSTEEAATILNSGGVVAFPTETVYGLGASICHPRAIEQIFRAKGRPGAVSYTHLTLPTNREV